MAAPASATNSASRQKEWKKEKGEKSFILNNFAFVFRSRGPSLLVRLPITSICQTQDTLSSLKQSQAKNNASAETDDQIMICALGLV